MAFSFEEVTERVHTSTEVGWTPDALKALDSLGRSFWMQRSKRLPIQALRMGLQVRDAKIIRTDTALGIRESRLGTLAFTHADPAAAVQHANAAVADWTLGTLTPLVEREEALQAQVGELRRLALAGVAVRAREQHHAVLTWETNRQTGTARIPFGSRQYAALADHVADLIEGHELYPTRGPMRRVVRKDLTSNEVDLLTDVITLPNLNDRGQVVGPDVRFSLGVTVSVETYPGRARPIIKIHHKKFVWAREPRSGMQKLSGYVLPAGETRALRFELSKNLELGADYELLVTTYSLPRHLSTAELGRDGTSGVYGSHRVVITHKNGRAETDAVLYGVSDLDRRDSFARLVPLLAPHGFAPWSGLEVVPTTSRSETDLDGHWVAIFGGNAKRDKKARKNAPAQLSLFGPVSEDAPEEAEAGEPTAAEQRKLQRQQALREKNLAEWSQRMQANIDAHYGGTHQLVIAYGQNLAKEAQKAEEILRTVLKEGATILLKRLPDRVHGGRQSLPGAHIDKPSERAEERVKAWAPFIEELREYQQAHPDRPLRSVLVLADRWYPGKQHDDVINKRVARVILNRSLGLTVQYLLPSKRLRDGSVPDKAEEDFRMRTMNAWRDLAWKGLGKMDGIEEKAREVLGAPGRPVLGLGVIRVNRTKFKKNDASFVPYAIELDPVTGACSGSVLLGRGDREAKATPFMPLPQLLRVLSEYGPSYLARGKDDEVTKARRAATQKFIAQVLVERTQLCPELIVLADAATLNGMWTWLSDANVNPDDVHLATQDHFEGNCPDAALIRIRPDISPKVVRDAPRVRIVVDGEVVPAATWSDADLYRVTDAAGPMRTYLSFGSKIINRPRAISSHLPVQEDKKDAPRPPYLDAYATPNAVDITVIRPGSLEPDNLARFVEALRREYAHFGSWINAPGPLHFASVLKEYIPDYDLSSEEEEEIELLEQLPDNGMDRLFPIV